MKEKSTEIRDRLCKLSEEVMASQDQEAHVIACCIALAVEELEKWIYSDNFTPSVRPYTDSRKFEIPFKPGQEDDKEYYGPPWDRKKKTIFDKSAVLAKLKNRGITLKTPQKVDLSKWNMSNLNTAEIDQFRAGSAGPFLKSIAVRTGVSIKEAIDYLAMLKAAYPLIWSVDNNPGDICPFCGSKNIGSHAFDPRPYCCNDCDSLWGFPAF